MGLDNPLHIAVLLLILLLVFGARRLPELGRSLGEGMRGFKESLTGEDKQQIPAPQAQQQPAPPAAAPTPAVQQPAAPAAPVPNPPVPAPPVAAPPAEAPPPAAPAAPSPGEQTAAE